jgi:hypothetical protein
MPECGIRFTLGTITASHSASHVRIIGMIFVQSSLNAQSRSVRCRLSADAKLLSSLLFGSRPAPQLRSSASLKLRADVKKMGRASLDCLPGLLKFLDDVERSVLSDCNSDSESKEILVHDVPAEKAGAAARPGFDCL